MLGLAPLDSTDTNLIRIWRNDYRIWRWCRQHDFLSDVAHAEWYRNQNTDPTIRMYKIATASQQLDDDSKILTTTVGVCGLTSIDKIHNHAEFSLYIAPEFQHLGYGSDALKCLLAHAFDNLNLHLVWGEVFAGNPALATFTKLGFKMDGIRREFYFRDGAYLDAQIISLTATEYRAMPQTDGRQQ